MAVRLRSIVGRLIPVCATLILLALRFFLMEYGKRSFREALPGYVAAAVLLLGVYAAHAIKNGTAGLLLIVILSFGAACLNADIMFTAYPLLLSVWTAARLTDAAQTPYARHGLHIVATVLPQYGVAVACGIAGCALRLRGGLLFGLQPARPAFGYACGAMLLVALAAAILPAFLNRTAPAETQPRRTQKKSASSKSRRGGRFPTRMLYGAAAIFFCLLVAYAVRLGRAGRPGYLWLYACAWGAYLPYLLYACNRGADENATLFSRMANAVKRAV